ncbi:MAG: hypothetical protein EXQ74_00400 [Thermoleophilia bacterium]|nr:hypothetical protein [Thermoleophilia bacterium]
MWVGRIGPGRASAGALVEPGSANRETVRRAVLACGVALAADRLAAAPPVERGAVIQAFGAARPDDLVDLTGRCVIGGLTVPPAGVSAPFGSAVAELLLEPGDDPDDAEVVITPGEIAPGEAAALAAAALARALPRDPLHLARTGVALRTIAREAHMYPETLAAMASGIAVTARDPEDIRRFAHPEGTSASPTPSRRWDIRDGRSLSVAAGAALVLAAVGIAVAAAVIAILDPAAANRSTALIVGAVIGGIAGWLVAIRLLRRP